MAGIGWHCTQAALPFSWHAPRQRPNRLALHPGRWPISLAPHPGGIAVQNEIRWGSTLAIRTSVSKWCAIGVLHPTACRTPLERTESDSARHILISISSKQRRPRIETKHRGRTSIQGSSKLLRLTTQDQNTNGKLRIKRQKKTTVTAICNCE